MKEQQGAFGSLKGWRNIGHVGEIHTIPVQDLEEHLLNDACPCRPERNREFPRIVVHHAFDGRDIIEQLEAGKKLL